MNELATDPSERIESVGYINDEREHALISIFNPAILNAQQHSVQVALTIEGARQLRAELDKFFIDHDPPEPEGE